MNNDNIDIMKLFNIFNFLFFDALLIETYDYFIYYYNLLILEILFYY